MANQGDSAGARDALAAQLVRETGDAVVVCGPDGKILLWNGGAERVFGYGEAEALGASLELIIPEKLRARHWEGYDKTMTTGETRYGGDSLLKVPATHKDGRRLSIEFSVALLRDDTAPDGTPGQVTGIAAIIRDATEQWNSDRALRKELSDLKSRLAEA